MNILKKSISFIEKAYDCFRKDFHIISFSQEGEDLILAKSFENFPSAYKGFYIDIGAFYSPVILGKHGGKFRKILLKYLSKKCSRSLLSKTQKDMNLLISKSITDHESSI